MSLAYLSSTELIVLIDKALQYIHDGIHLEEGTSLFISEIKSLYEYRMEAGEPRYLPHIHVIVSNMIYVTSYFVSEYKRLGIYNTNKVAPILQVDSFINRNTILLSNGVLNEL